MRPLKQLELTWASVARKIAYAFIFTGVLICYAVVTVRPPMEEYVEVYRETTTSLQMLANQSDSSSVTSYVPRMLTYGDFMEALSNCQSPDTENRFCTIKPPENILSVTPPVFLDNYRNPCWAIPEDFLEGPPIACMPYYFLIGAPKSGTTDLYERLSRHPQISGMVKKELHWFTRRRYTYKTATKLPQLPYFSNYTDLFKWANQDIYDNQVEHDYHKKIVGDNSVSTLWDNSYVMKYNAIAHMNLTRAPAAIRHFNPKTKFISIIRNPVERTYSDFLYFNSEEKKSQEKFHRLVVEGINYHTSCLKYLTIRECLDKRPGEQKEVRLWVGLYYHYFLEFFESFPRDQFFIMKLEDYSPNVKTYLVDIFDFLELDPIDEDTLFTVAGLGSVANKQTRTIGDMFPETRQLLVDFYRPYNDQLGELLGDNFNYNNFNKETS